MCGITINVCILKQILRKNVPWRVTSVTLQSSPAVGEKQAVLGYYVTDHVRVRVLIFNRWNPSLHDTSFNLIQHSLEFVGFS